jgi:hypothetical protein
MSITVAHRPHRHVPWLPMVVVLAVVAAAVLIALLTIGSSRTTPATSGTQALGADGGAQVPAAALPAPAPLKYARAPWEPAGGSTALAAAGPAPVKYVRAPWTGGGGTPHK